MASNRVAFKRQLVDGRDESVEVNQRALIDKVLARYSGEFTVFRELLQNSDDAKSSAVEIRFETATFRLRKNAQQRMLPLPELPDLRSAAVTQWTFKNNGITFREEDWSRLRKIAEGNPDEQKIGAFGVGFYSLFSVTEDPFVSSGGYGMEFYWKDNKDQLSVRHGKLPGKGAADPWTTFEMVLREAGPIPHAFNLMRFLASSITFMVHLNEVGVYFDGHRIGHIQKSPGVAEAINLPVALKPVSQLNIMNVKAVQSQPIRIEATVMHAVNAVATEKSALPEVSETYKSKKGFFSSLISGPAGQSAHLLDTSVQPSGPSKAPTEMHKMDVTLTIFTADVDVKVDKRLSAEFLRSTKKNPPAWLKYHLIYTGKVEYDKSLADDKNQSCGSIFQGLRADLDGATHTRIFIGHATGQTTGVGGHMASHFIPTVERESVDFVDKNIATWNKELLYVGGLLARVAYESELSAIHNLWTSATDSAPHSRPPQELQSRLQERCFHALKFFTFYHSTPSADVSQLLEASFYGCSTSHLRMLSSVGVREVSDIKEYDPIFAKFLKGIPMLPQSTLTECGRIVRTLKNQGLLSPVQYQDVLNYLRQHQLNKEELVSYLRWWIGVNQDSDSLSTNVAQLDAVVISNDDGSILPLASVKHFADPRALGHHIPPDSPLPLALLRHDIAKEFTFAELSSFGWEEFTAVDWLGYILRRDIMSADPTHDFTKSPNWAAQVITVFSRIWSSASNDARFSTRKRFIRHTCIPTSYGMLTPADSYLPGTSTALFRDLDLPMVLFPNGFKITEDIETFLLFIGVRKHVDPQLILNRMTETGNWNITGLIGYLVQVRKSLTGEEVARLQSSPIFAKESTVKDTTRYYACELYAPTEICRQLQLPVIQWDEKCEWSSDSNEAELLFLLGLRDHPPLEEIPVLCSSEDAEVRTTAFWYFCNNLTSKYSDYDPRKFEDIAFIPAENNHSKHLGKLRDVFSGEQWKLFGFSVIQADYRDAPTSELGILEHPPTSVLLSRLERAPPSDEAAAREWFEILLERISTFEPPELVRLTNLPMVPTNCSGVRKQLTPTQCYISEGPQDSFYSKLFDFVDFGPAANRFLSACGSRNEPSLKDVAESLVRDPKRFRELSGEDESFLTHLRNFAVNKSRIPNLTLIGMKNKSILLGRKTIVRKEGDLCVQELRSPKEVVIADDINAYHLFRDAVFIAPQEELLEDFYVYLGCKRLSDVVQEHCEVGDEISDIEKCSEMRALILERLTLFLHEYTHTKPRVSLAWLSDPENFKVKACNKLSVSKTLVVENTKAVQSQDASAGARRVEKGWIELWLSHNGKTDMYEVSTSLCRVLFGTAKVSESLLFSTILSTDLDALRRRGCNVNLILNRRQAEQDQPNWSISGVELHQLTHTPRDNVMDPETPSALTGPSVHPLAQASESRPTGTEAATALKHQQMTQVEPSSSYVSLPDRSEAMQSTPMTSVALPPCNSKQRPQTRVGSMIRKVFSRSRSPGTVGTIATPLLSVWNQQRVIPLDVIQNNIDIAIRACNPEYGQVIHQPSNGEAAMESLNDHYCHDVSGKADNLKFLDTLLVVSPHTGSTGTVKVFATEDVPNLDTFMTSKKASLNRFISIVIPIAEVHGLSMTILNIFYDVGGGSIAFNRDGSLFLNLRYFEAWHDRDVEKGDQQRAQISWFFTLAHEIAHNLVKSHNSEHAFWFSAICEARISALEQIVGPMARH